MIGVGSPGMDPDSKAAMTYSLEAFNRLPGLPVAAWRCAMEAERGVDRRVLKPRPESTDRAD